MINAVRMIKYFVSVPVTKGRGGMVFNGRRNVVFGS